MPTGLPIPIDDILARVRERYDVFGETAELLDAGDTESRVYRVHAKDGDRFLKHRPAPVNEAGLGIPRLLADRGIGEAVAPIPTTTGELFDEFGGGVLVLYPFVEGVSGGEAGMTPASWTRLGIVLRRVHEIDPPRALAESMRAEDFTPIDAERVRAIGATAEDGSFADPPRRAFVAFWLQRRRQIDRLASRTERLADLARPRREERVICHADIHPWNVMVTTAGKLAIVDWDDATLAPRERDLMMIGIGAGGGPDDPDAFWRGYGGWDVDPVLIAYYRHERVVQDLAAYGAQVLATEATGALRAEGLEGLLAMFRPGGEVVAAIASDEALAL